MREALRVWKEQEQLRELPRNRLRKDIQAGLESGDATPLDFEDIKKRGRTRLKQAAKGREECRHPYYGEVVQTLLKTDHPC